MEQRSTSHQVKALSRGLNLLRLLATHRRVLALRDLNQLTGLPKPTLVRLLSVLEENGFVARYDEGFLLGSSVLELVGSYEGTADVLRFAEPYLAALAAETGQTANLGFLEGRMVRHLAVIEADRPIRFRSMTGSLDDSYCTALGKVLLAALPQDRIDAHLPTPPFPERTVNTITSRSALIEELAQIRDQGFAEDQEEGDLGVRCLSVRLESDKGLLVALSIAGPAGEITEESRTGFLEQLDRTAQAMQSDSQLRGALDVACRQLVLYPGFPSDV